MSKLPAIRQDLSLEPIADDSYGFPRWCLHNQVNSQYFIIGWTEYEILKRWHYLDPKKISKSITKETTLNVSENKVINFSNKLINNELIAVESSLEFDNLVEKSIVNSQASKGIRSFFMITFPLLKPDDFLSKTMGYAKLFVSKAAITLYFLLSFMGLYLVSQDWYNFTANFAKIFNLSNFPLFVISIFVVKLVHEFTHAYVAKFYGCYIGDMGVVVNVFRPLLYVDITDAWRIKDKSKRIRIESAGLISELVVAGLSLFLWNFVGEGSFKTTLFFIATFSWFSSFVINLNIFYKYDGYYILSDYIGIENLQEISHKLFLWRIKELFFGLGLERPYYFSAKKQLLLILYAIGVLFFNFLVVSTVSLMVYLIFFKALGILIMFAYLFYFILFPIAKELKGYWQARKDLIMNHQTIRTMIISILLLLLFFIPWQSQIVVPGFIEFKQKLNIYNQIEGQLKNINFKSGQKVKQDQILFIFDNKNLEHRVKTLIIDNKILENKYDISLNNLNKLGHQSTSKIELLRNKNSIYLNKREIKKLIIRAKYNGNIYFDNETIQKNRYLAKNTKLGELIGSSEKVAYGYVSEKNIARIKAGMEANVLLNNGIQLQALISDIDLAAVEELSRPYQASIYGGEVDVFLNQDDNLHVKNALYRVKFKINNDKELALHPGIATIYISGERQSYAVRTWNFISHLVLNQSGF